MIFKHELKINLKSFLIWTSTIALTNFCFMLMYPSMESSLKRATDAYANMGSLTAAFGMDRLSIASALGFYGIEVGTILSLGGALFAAIIGTGILSKEEGGHTSEYLYTLPYSRINVTMQKTVAVFVIILAFDLVNMFFGFLSFPLIHATIHSQELLLYHAAQFSMHIEIAAICILISSILKKVSLGSGLGVALLLYFLDMMSRVLTQLKFAKYITPFYYANAADVMVNKKIDPSLLTIGMVVALICIISATWYYNQRDLAS